MAQTLAMKASQRSLWFRVLYLALLSLLNLGLQTSYDSVGASAPVLRDAWGMDAEAIGDLIAAYHLPNVVMAAMGGILVDWIGGELASVLFATFVVAGTAIASGAHTLQAMLLGRVILGLGGESLVVAQLSILTHSFPMSGSGSVASFPSQGVALALQLMVTRAATLGTFMLLPAAYDTDHLAYLAKGAEAAANGGRAVQAPPSAFEAGPGGILVGMTAISFGIAVALLFMNACLGYSTPAQVNLLSCLQPSKSEDEKADAAPGGKETGLEVEGENLATDKGDSSIVQAWYRAGIAARSCCSAVSCGLVSAPPPQGDAPDAPDAPDVTKDDERQPATADGEYLKETDAEEVALAAEPGTGPRQPAVGSVRVPEAGVAGGTAEPGNTAYGHSVPPTHRIKSEPQFFNGGYEHSTSGASALRASAGPPERPSFASYASGASSAAGEEERKRRAEAKLIKKMGGKHPEWLVASGGASSTAMGGGMGGGMGAYRHSLPGEEEEEERALQAIRGGKSTPTSYMPSVPAVAPPPGARGLKHRGAANRRLHFGGTGSASPPRAGAPGRKLGDDPGDPEAGNGSVAFGERAGRAGASHGLPVAKGGGGGGPEDPASSSRDVVEEVPLARRGLLMRFLTQGCDSWQEVMCGWQRGAGNGGGRRASGRGARRRRRAAGAGASAGLALDDVDWAAEAGGSWSGDDEDDGSDPGDPGSSYQSRASRRAACCCGLWGLCASCSQWCCCRAMGCDDCGCDECYDDCECDELCGDDGCCGCLDGMDACGCSWEGGCCGLVACGEACGCDALAASCYSCYTCEADPPSPDGTSGVTGDRWVLFLLGSFLVLWSGAMITFVDFATDLFSDRWGYTPSQAGRTTSLLTLCAIVLMVPVGALLDATGQVGGLLVGGASLTGVGIVQLWLLPVMPPEYGAVLIGVGAAIVSAVIWPALGQVIPSDSRGSVLGFLLCLQNLVLCFGPMALGVLRDAGGGYDEALVIFAVLVGVCVAICAAILVAWYQAMHRGNKKAR